MRVRTRAAAFFLLACGLTVRAAAGQDSSGCLTCHDAGGLAKSRHGNQADTRTPSCQSCHGDSAKHLVDPTDAPDVVFGATSKHLSSADARNAACLTCHERQVLPRTSWAGSQHRRRGVACSDCHTAHTPAQKVIDKRTQADVCFTCHKDQRAHADRVDSTAKKACSDCHSPHGPTGGARP